jgi:hypothetical protein
MGDLISENVQTLVLLFWTLFIMTIIFGAICVKIFKK